MAVDFVMSARRVRGRGFIAEPGPSAFLLVPSDGLPRPSHAVDPEIWQKKLRKQAVWGRDERLGFERGDILVFVHGYNNDQETVMRRHRRLTLDLREAGFRGVVMSFDWPSDDAALNYLEDRHDAKHTAMQLVTDGIRLLSAEQTPDCTINIHLLGHSTGAYVIREAFDDADDARLENTGWFVSQLVFIGADVSADSLADGHPTSDSLFRHCQRLTNYSNRFDNVLKLSNFKRMGVAPRAGRIGLPSLAPRKAVNVDCSAYFEQLANDPQIAAADQSERIGAFAHAWHIGNRLFARDLFETLRGDLDRTVIPTRMAGSAGTLELIRA